MTTKIKARALACALVAGVVLGSGIGLALGVAYWAGCKAQSAALEAGRLHVRPAVTAAAPAPSSGLRTLDFNPAAKPVQGVLAASAQVQPLKVHTRADARDRDCLAEAVYYEARGEGHEGQAAVAQVVMNRLRQPAFPKSVCGVVFQKDAERAGCQFSFVCDGSMRRPRELGAWRQAEQMAERALQGVVAPAIGDATHFHVVGLQPGWGPRLLQVAQVGLHVFYKFGRPSAGALMVAHAQTPHALFGPPEQATPAARPSGQYILASNVAVAAPASAVAPAAAAATAAPVAQDAAAVAPQRAAPVKAEKPAAEPKAKAEAAAPASAPAAQPLVS